MELYRWLNYWVFDLSVLLEIWDQGDGLCCELEGELSLWELRMRVVFWNEQEEEFFGLVP